MARIAIALSLAAVVVTLAANTSLGESGVVPRETAPQIGLGGSRALQIPFFFSFDRWAVVKWDGTLLSGRGVVSATRTHQGDYRVSFALPVRDCAWLATIRTVTIGADEPSAVAIKAETVADPRSVEVVTFNDTGLGAGFADASFSLEVVC